MSVRLSRVSRSIRSLDCSSELPLVDHACGALASHLACVRSDALSLSVSRYMVADAGGSVWNRCMFAYELFLLQSSGGLLCRDARRLVSWWIRAGQPRPWVAA